jgi:DNA-binding beta-propeller fold protein YncE
MKKLVITLSILLFGIYSFSQGVTSVIDSNGVDINDGLAYDGSQYFYGSSFTEGSIYRFDLQGNVEEFATGLTTANGLLVHRNGNLLAADPSGNRIVVYNTLTAQAIDTISIPSPGGMVHFNNSDTLLVTDWTNDRIYKLDPTGAYTDYVIDFRLNAPIGISYMTGTNEYFVANFNNSEVFNITGGQMEYVATLPSTSAGIRWVGFISCTDTSLFATAYNHHQVLEVHTNQTDDVEVIAGISGVSGHVNGDLDSATFFNPNGIYAISDDSILVSEYDMGIVRLISRTDTSISTNIINLVSANKLQLGVYPNPATNRVSIQLANAEFQGIQLMDLSGRVVEVNQSRIAENVIELHTSNLKSGIYLIRADGYYTERLIIE